MSGASKAARWPLVTVVIAVLLAALWIRIARPRVEPVQPAQQAGAIERGSTDGDAPVRSSEVSSRPERVAAAHSGGTLLLTFRREPDGEPIHPRAIQVSCDDVEVPSVAVGAGRFRLARPTVEGALVVVVPRYEPETIGSGRWRDTEALEVLLRPVEGLHGRVVEVDGAPAAGVPVLAFRPAPSVALEFLEGRAPRVRVFDEPDTIAVATSSADGRFFLDVPTRLPGAPVTLRAFGDVRRIAECVVPLPRTPEPLPDLVLGAPPSVEVRVVDPEGSPLEGIAVFSNLPSFLALDADGEPALRTDADGRCAVPALYLPTNPRPTAAGWYPVARRIDGRDADWSEPLRHVGQTVEWTLRRTAFVEVAVVDARTGGPVEHDQVQLVPKLRGVPVGSMAACAFAADGSKCYGFLDASGGEFAQQAPDYDEIEASVSWSGYRPLRRSVPRSELAPGGRLVLEFEPEETARHVSGRVLAHGEPVPRASVFVRGIPPGSPGSNVSFGHARGETDGAGRFELLWVPRDPAERLAVEARDPLHGGIVALGPMDPDLAVDLILELEGTIEVPLVLSGASEGETYALRFELDGDDEHRPWWTERVAAVDLGGGVIGAMLTLPDCTPVLVARNEALVDEPDAVRERERRFDPASSAISLELDVRRPKARLTGRASVPVGGDSLLHHVVVAPAEVDGARRPASTPASAVGPRGQFAFEGLPLGTWELLLVRSDGRGRSDVVGRLEVQLEADRDDVVLVANSD